MRSFCLITCVFVKDSRHIGTSHVSMNMITTVRGGSFSSEVIHQCRLVEKRWHFTIFCDLWEWDELVVRKDGCLPLTRLEFDFIYREIQRKSRSPTKWFIVPVLWMPTWLCLVFAQKNRKILLFFFPQKFPSNSRHVSPMSRSSFSHVWKLCLSCMEIGNIPSCNNTVQNNKARDPLKGQTTKRTI